MSPAAPAIWRRTSSPGENELYYLINEPMRYMEEYGDGIYAVIGGGDPYEAFEACQAAVNE